MSAPPTGRTAVRPAWADLPAALRARVEARLAAPVVGASSRDDGFTPGFASVLDLADGSRVFVKAADDATRAPFAAAYRSEARWGPVLPAGARSPRLRWVDDADGWVVLCFDAVDGRRPGRPWSGEELDLVLAGLDDVADSLSPVPEGRDLPLLADEVADLAGRWDGADPSVVPGGAAAVVRGRLLASTFLERVRADDADEAVNLDLRDDNVLLDAGGRVWVCDWNDLVRGPGWWGHVVVLLSAHGDGLDADLHLRRCRATATVDPALVDGALALLAGYYLEASTREVVPTSPRLRDHQRWYAEAALGWLDARGALRPA